MKRLFIFARHAESSANVAHLMSSDPARPIDLTAGGRQQARRLGEHLSNIQIDLAVHTRFLRTRQTAELALEGRRIPFMIEPALDEVHAGAFDGAAISEYWSWKEQHPRTEPFPQGESLDDAARRYTSALWNLLQRREPVTLVVTHELAIRYILEAADGTTSLDCPWSDIPNASPYLFDEDKLRGAASCLRTLAGLAPEVAGSIGVGSGAQLRVP